MYMHPDEIKLPTDRLVRGAAPTDDQVAACYDQYHVSMGPIVVRCINFRGKFIAEPGASATRVLAARGLNASRVAVVQVAELSEPAELVEHIRNKMRSNIDTLRRMPKGNGPAETVPTTMRLPGWEIPEDADIYHPDPKIASQAIDGVPPSFSLDTEEEREEIFE